MALIYFAGPVDLEPNTDGGAATMIKELTAKGHVVYNATSALACDPSKVTKQMARDVIQHHRDMLEVAEVVVVDLSRRSIGVPIEMAIAHERKGDRPPILGYIPSDGPKSLYAIAMLTGAADDWTALTRMVLSVEYAHSQTISAAVPPNVGQLVGGRGPDGRFE